MFLFVCPIVCLWNSVQMYEQWTFMSVMVRTISQGKRWKAQFNVATASIRAFYLSRNEEWFSLLWSMDTFVVLFYYELMTLEIFSITHICTIIFKIYVLKEFALRLNLNEVEHALGLVRPTKPPVKWNGNIQHINAILGIPWKVLSITASLSNSTLAETWICLSQLASTSNFRVHIFTNKAKKANFFVMTVDSSFLNTGVITDVWNIFSCCFYH